MPEIKNVFVKGKMNQDFDERLLPKGEYREGQNIQVANSDDDDVGAIENVKGNELAYSAPIANQGDECIGAFVDTGNNRIFWYITNFSDASESNITNMTRAGQNTKMSIIMKDGDQEPVTLVTGIHLNFNKQKLITGINVIDNFLFWTDNFNQPRCLNINIANPQHPDHIPNYYAWEDKLSVAKIAPYEGPLLHQSNLGTPDGSVANGTTLVRDADVESDFMQERFIRFAYRYKFEDSQYSIISPFTQSVFKPLNDGKLRQTRSQVNTTNADEGTGAGSGTGREPNVSISELDVAHKTTLDIMQNSYNKVKMRIPLPRRNEFAGGTPPTTYANDYNIDKVEILLKESDGLAVRIVDEIQLSDIGLTFGCYYQPITHKTFTVDGTITNLGSTTNLTLKVAATATAKVNESGTHSGQTFNVDNVSGTINVGDRVMAVGQNSTFGTNVVKVTAINGTEITLNTANDFALADNTDLIFIPNVEINYIVDNMSASSLGTSGFRVVTNVDLDGNKPRITLNEGITVQNNSSIIFKKVYWREHVEYTYTSQKPYKVLPENQILRVSDKIPVRAQAQEVVGNRLVYGNITQNYTLPVDTNNREGIDYTVQEQVKGASEFNAVSGIFQHNRNTYRHHNLKQRRTYKVGIVLSDKFGRKSPVILSTHTSTDLSDTFTTLADVQDKSALNSGNYSWSANEEAIGKALAVTFNDDYIVENSKVYDQVNNPNGWYSWRFVVQQKEQDYHNVYSNFPVTSWSNVGTTSTAHDSLSLFQRINGKLDTGSKGRSWLTLHGENINKVPRSVDKEFDFDREGLSGSDAQLYPKVIGDNAGGTSRMPNVSQALIQSQKPLKVLSIGTAVDQGLFTGEDAVIALTNSAADLKAKRRIYPFVYNAKSNPLVAELPNLKKELVNMGPLGGFDPILHDLENVPLDRPFGTPNDPNIGEANVSNPHQAAGVPFGRAGLIVFETKPVESNLDIFFETSTGGLIKDLNDIIDEQPNQGPSSISLSSTSFPESQAPNTNIGNVSAILTNGSIINVQLLSAVDGNGNDHSSKFAIVNNSGAFALQNTQAIEFSNITGKDNFSVTLKVTQTGGNTGTGVVNVNVTNSSPAFGSTIAGNSKVGSTTPATGTVILEVGGTNGTHSSNQNKKLHMTAGSVRQFNLNPGTGSVISGLEIEQSPVGNFKLKTTANYSDSALFPGNNTSVTVEMSLTDNGGLTAFKNVTFTKVTSLTIAGWAHATNPCNEVCLVGSTNFYATKGSSALAPDAFNLYAGNIIFIDQAQTTRLFAGTTGKFVYEPENSERSINNGVVQAGIQVCPNC